MFDLLATRAQFITLFGKLLALRGELSFERGQFFFLPGRGLALLAQLIQKRGAIGGQLHGQCLQCFVIESVEIWKRANIHEISMPWS